MGRLSTTECTYLPTYLQETYPHKHRSRWGNRCRLRRRTDICPTSRGVLGTASPPSLEQTMGGLDYTQAWQRVPRTGAGGGVSVLRPTVGQDLHMNPRSHINGNNSPKVDEIPQNPTGATCK